MGCQGLDYCTNFNNRPTELFRSCNRMADEGARKEVAMWTETGAITLPEFQDFKIPIKGTVNLFVMICVLYSCLTLAIFISEIKHK